MADFLDKLSEAIEARRENIELQLRTQPAPGEQDLERLVQDHWLALPPSPPPSGRPAYAIDGSVGEASLDNGCFVFIVQALCIGSDACEQPRADIQILPPATPRSTAMRFADLFQRHHELSLACEMAGRIPEGGVLYLDGALYGFLPQLYALPLDGWGVADELPDVILAEYLQLVETCRRRGVQLVAVAKTSREATHCKLWLEALDLASDKLTALTRESTDSQMIHRWTDGAAGHSVPVVLGKWGFTGGSRAMLDQPEVCASPAIVSFFVRLAELDDALRIDVPACQLGLGTCLGDLEGAVLDDGPERVRPVIDLLAADYGGLEVYNALLYSVDREVRLKRTMLRDVYLPLIEGATGLALRRDRSQRRFA